MEKCFGAVYTLFCPSAIKTTDMDKMWQKCGAVVGELAGLNAVWKCGLATVIREELSASQLDRLPITLGGTLCLTFLYKVNNISV